jgi:hypothetical protein
LFFFECVAFCLLTCLPTYLPTCLPAYLPTYLPAYLPATCLPTYLPAYLLIMAPNTPPKKSTQLEQDDRIRVLALRDASFTYQQIANQLHITYCQVQYTCESQKSTPRKAKGQPPKLSESDVDDIINWISVSKQHRHLPFVKVVKELDLPVGVTALARALKKRGYTCCKALSKPPLSNTNKRIRLAWALEHINWTPI